MSLPAGDHAAAVVEPGKEPFDFSAALRASPRPAAPVRATARTDSRFEHGPLGVGQVHAVEYDGDHTAVSGGFRIYETASSLQHLLRLALLLAHD